MDALDPLLKAVSSRWCGLGQDVPVVVPQHVTVMDDVPATASVCIYVGRVHNMLNFVPIYAV